MKPLVDYILEEDYARYLELLKMAADAKANAPKSERKKRGPMTTEQKIAAAKTRRDAAEEKLAALLAAENA